MARENHTSLPITADDVKFNDEIDMAGKRYVVLENTQAPAGYRDITMILLSNENDNKLSLRLPYNHPMLIWRRWK